MTDRKLKVLAAVVDEYIKTGEPVGSRKVASALDIKVSSATIRNDMATLEQMGFLMQPHTSAGRIPTYAGFRLYIRKLIEEDGKYLPEDEIRRLDEKFDNGDRSEENLLRNASSTLAEITNCAAVATNNSFKFSVISKVEVIPAGRRVYVILLITSNGGIKNRACRLKVDLSDKQIDVFEEYMKENLQGIPIGSFSEEKLRDAATALGTYMTALSPLIEGLSKMVTDMNSDTVTMSGEENLFSYEDISRGDIIKFVSRKNELSRFLDDAFSDLNIVFGDENSSDFVIGNSSMISTHYMKNGRPVGSLGIIGPIRIEYSKVIPYLYYFSNKLTDYITYYDDQDDENDENNEKEK